MNTHRMFARLAPACADDQPTAQPLNKGEPNDLDQPAVERAERRFRELRRLLAAKGVDLQRTDRQDGPVSYWIESYGVTHRCASIEEVQDFLKATEVQHGH